MLVLIKLDKYVRSLIVTSTSTVARDHWRCSCRSIRLNLRRQWELDDRYTTSPDHAGLRANVHTNEPAVVRNAPLAAGIVSDGLLARGVAAAVPAYNPSLGYDYGLNPYGLAYNRLGLGYGYGSALGHTGLLGSYGSLYA
ncbi:hypothetical protein HNY73_016004 [Argiope bruennichi]|uniref:Uncharacterized protein n=1 Tax=Argiope bruennichi TaxID=94029 RepID=A0A8T0EH48_ARGBR|nr:hypothetical protein HNY73_016004 [Argiope bruennichi]